MQKQSAIAEEPLLEEGTGRALAVQPQNFWEGVARCFCLPFGGGDAGRITDATLDAPTPLAVPAVP
jgi:hypothetical protein